MTYNYRDDPILGPALAYWLRKRGASVMPRKRDIDATDISLPLLPYLQLIDVIDEGARFRYRLVGTALVNAYGKDYTGRYADEFISGDRLDFIQNVYRAVCRSQGPIFVHNCYHTLRKTRLTSNRIYMPLGDDGAPAQYIFGALNFTFGSGTSRGEWGNATLESAERYIEPIEIED